MIGKNEIGATILRLFVGVTFFVHGVSKFQNAIENTVGFFESLGLPGFTAYLVALVELIGGLALIVGLGTRYIAIIFAVIMVVAIVKVKLAVGFLGNGQMAGYELDLSLLAICIYLAYTNRSSLSLDNVILRIKEA